MEYLSPGVYIEEVSYRPKSIEGVSTSTCALCGPTRYGPVRGEPPLLTSFADFERVYGGLDPLVHEGTSFDNFTAHAARSFFSEGGRRLYVSRIYTPPAVGDGHASQSVGPLSFRARYPGASGNVVLQTTLNIGQDVLDRDVSGQTTANGIKQNDTVWLVQAGSGLACLAERVVGTSEWNLHPAGGGATVTLSSLDPDADSIHILSANLELGFVGRRGDEETIVRTEVWDDLTFEPVRRRSLTRVFAKTIKDQAEALAAPIIVTAPGARGPDICQALFALPADLDPAAVGARTVQSRSAVRLDGGFDGQQPDASAYEGAGSEPAVATGLKALEHIADISIVAAPAHVGLQDPLNLQQAAAHLVRHAEGMRYRVAVLDVPKGGVASARSYRGRFDSKYAAMYYPWVQIIDPTTGEPLYVPPSGFVSGIYARNDVERGVHKAPANEVVRSAIGLDVQLNQAHQDVLNPLGVNCIRFFEGRGIRIWGARTATSDSEWRYISLRRYFAYLERSIELGSQFAVFEPNGDRLWANVRRTIEDFLRNEWQNGRLLGLKPEQAFFVRCDRRTMTQNDLDSGRLVCEVGVSPLRPAEFVIFRIGQWTGDSRQ